MYFYVSGSGDGKKTLVLAHFNKLVFDRIQRLFIFDYF